MPSPVEAEGAVGTAEAAPNGGAAARATGTAARPQARDGQPAAKPADTGHSRRPTRTRRRSRAVSFGGWAGSSSGGGVASGARQAWLHSCKGALAVLRRHPSILLVSLLVTGLLMAAGVAGVLAAVRSEVQHRRDNAQGFVDNVAVGFERLLQQMMAPLLALAAFVHEYPDYPSLAANFDKIARDLFEMPESNAVASLQLAPHGVVRSIYPMRGNEAALGLDLLKDPRHRPAALETIEHGHASLQGPLLLRQGGYGVIVRLPVFQSGVGPNETFGAPGAPYNCSMCYNATTGTMFWGFATCLIYAGAIVNGTDARLQSLVNQGFDYELQAPQPDGTTFSVVKAPVANRAPVSAWVTVPNGQWLLLIAPSRGWLPSWRDPMLVTAVVLSVLIGLLVCAILVNRRQLIWVISELKGTNAALADEKRRMDALLVRQIALINAMGRGGGGGGGGVGGPSGAAAFGSSGGDVGGSGDARSIHSLTLERIQDLRQNIGASSAITGAEELELLELLGEGSFGKVFRGMWRGSVVAIKTMILPARMSGAEKRERMLVMEAAISTALLHPNIVQTYTYTIKSTVDSYGARNADGSSRLSPTTCQATSGGLQPAGSSQQARAAQELLPSGPHVHNYEVCLVLEYCDRGSLRDALDSGAFWMPDGSINYPAVLDTAADIARAMAHLHRQQVIHSDLKARNCLLKSDGSDGRGLVAKIADFGLAVRIGDVGTHVSEFQGTQTHMSPEAQLSARISKAGDVYSFGITCWELYTCGHAFADVPAALLGHRVAVQGTRPPFPRSTPTEFRALAERCWAEDPEARPTFEEVLDALNRMRQRLSGPTLPLGPIRPPCSTDNPRGPGPASSGSGSGSGSGSFPSAAGAERPSQLPASGRLPPAGGQPRHRPGSWGSILGGMPLQWARLDTICDAPDAAADTPGGQDSGASHVIDLGWASAGLGFGGPASSGLSGADGGGVPLGGTWDGGGGVPRRPAGCSGAADHRGSQPPSKGSGLGSGLSGSALSGSGLSDSGSLGGGLVCAGGGHGSRAVGGGREGTVAAVSGGANARTPAGGGEGAQARAGLG